MKRPFAARLKRGSLILLPIAIALLATWKVLNFIAELAKKIPGPKVTDALAGIFLIFVIIIIADKFIDKVPLDRPLLKLLERKMPFFRIYKTIMEDKEGKVFREVTYYDGGRGRKGILMSEPYRENLFGREVIVYNILEPRPGSLGGRVCQMEKGEFWPTGRSGFETLKEITIGYGIR